MAQGVQPKETRETRSFTARLAANSLNVLQQLADENERSLAYYVQKAIDAYVEEHGGKKRK
jgi:predicted DNA-binding protein